MSKLMPFRFLNLPPELRNRVYDFAQETPQDQTHLVTHLKPRKNVRAFNRTAECCPLAKPPTRQYLALTQVCRLLRKEFRPLYMKRNEVWLLPKDVLPYMGTYLIPSWVSGEASRRLKVSTASLVVDLMPLTEPTMRPLQQIKIHNFVRWSYMTNITFRFTWSNNPWTDSGYNTLMTTALDKVIFGHLEGWKTYSNGIERIVVYNGGKVRGMCVKFLPTFMQIESEADNNSPAQLLEFMKATGFESEPGFFLRIKLGTHIWAKIGALSTFRKYR